ncbi:MAG: M1 family aminopeptidase [bacterium]|nr:M1 family aminopeptidase [bacterium]
MKRNWKIAKTILATGLILVAASVLAGSDDGVIVDWDKATPSQIHEKLWEGKARSLLDQEFTRSLKSSETAANTQTNYDVLFYDINIRVDDTTENLYGVVKFVATAVDPSVSQVEVDFQSNMTVDSIVNPTGTNSYTRSGNVVTVTLDKAYLQGEQFEFDFYYHGQPIEDGLQAFSFGWRSGDRVIASLSEPYLARTWWPCKDRMDDKADSFYISIMVDTAFYVGSNGLIQSVDTTGNAHSYHYRVGYPMATYLFSVAISPYTVWQDTWYYNGGLDSMPLIHAVFPDMYNYSLTHYDATPEVLTHLSDAFGQYPFDQEKYGHSSFLWGGGMEHQTMTSMTGGTFGFSLPVVIHEAAHQWWGDMITCESWPHIWLNEGWASYAEAVFYLQKFGWADYHSYMNGMAYSGGGTIYISDTTDVWNIFSTIVYDKGAWVCHMLRGVLGDSLFNEGVNAYYNSQHQFAAATTEDFRDVFEQATGVELDWFFEDWIYGTYRPDYVLSYWEEPADSTGFDLYVHVRQKQTTSPNVFRMPVDLYFQYASGGDSTMMVADLRDKTARFNNPASVTTVKVDPSNWVLKYSSTETWTMHLISFDGDLGDGEQLAAYEDTVYLRGGSGDYTYSINEGSLPSGLSINSSGIISGTTTEVGSFTFTVNVLDRHDFYRDKQPFTLNILPMSGGVPGDFDVSFELNISDVTDLVDFMFAGGAAPLVPNLVDVDASCDISITDLTAIVDYLFNSGAPLVLGCVN